MTRSKFSCFVQTKTLSSLFSLSALSLAMLTATPAFAEESQEDASESEVEHVTVYGTTQPMTVMEYPGQVSVVDAEQLELYNPSSMADLLRDVPGLVFTGGPRRTGQTPSIRGRSGENVLILLDGARQSFLSAHDGRFFLDPDLVRRAEVVRGPASALYGSGAVGGVLAFETIRAEDLLDAGEHAGYRIKAGYQDVNQENMLSATAFGRGEKWDAVANIMTRNSGDITLGSDAELPSDDDITSGLVKLSYDATEDLRLQFSWQRFDNNAIEPNNGQGVSGIDGDQDVDKNIVSDNVRFNAVYTSSNYDWLNLDLTVYQSDSEVKEFDASLNRTILREIKTNGATLRNHSDHKFWGINGRLTVGVDWFRDEQTGTDTNSMDGLRGGVPNAEADFLGLFAQFEMTVQEPMGLPGELVLLPAVRFDEFDSESEVAASHSDNAVSPRLAASYQPNGWFRVFASVAEGFRAPSINELYLNGVHFSLPHPTLFNPQEGALVFINNNFIPNAELQAEESFDREIGFSIEAADLFSAGDSFQTKLSFFDSDIDNMIDLNVDFAFDPTCFAPPFQPCSAGTTNSQNLSNATLQGVEWETRYSMDNWFFSVAYSRVDGTNSENGNDLGSLTPDRVALDMRWNNDANTVTLGSRMLFAREFTREEIDRQTNEFAQVERRAGYGIADLYARWRPEAVPNLGVVVGVDNVFDKNYEQAFQGVSAAGRNAKVQFTWQQNF